VQHSLTQGSPGVPPVLVAAAVIVHEGRVLLTRRQADAHLGGYWEFPGGKMEPGEAPETCVVRECREECGIEVAVGDILEVTHHAYPEKTVLLLFYACTWVSGEVRHLGVADHAWVAAEDLDRYPLPPADERVVHKVRQLLDAGG
jgi:8-oxo-dGTP diphosphatase